MRRILVCCIFFITFFFVSPALIQACSCIQSGPPCQALWNTDVVFSGKVVESEVVDRKKSANENELPVEFKKLTVRFAVGESFRGGNGEKFIEVETGMGGGDCGFGFISTLDYLVYAYRNKETGKLTTGICTRTQLLSEAKEDLEYFRSLKNAKSGGTVYGTVLKRFVRKSNEDYKPDQPLANIRLIFESSGGSFFDALTDAKGEYRLSNIAAGEYKMRVKMPAGLWSYEETQIVKIPDKGCAVTYTSLTTKTFVGGKLQTADGVPLKKIGINLIPVNQINERFQSDARYASTDETGRFLFVDVPPGNYYLGVRLSRIGETNLPYPRTFYPGTTEIKNAVPVTVVEGQVVENYDITLGKKLSSRKISGTISMPDGKPAVKASVCIEEVEYSESSMCRDGIVTNEKGEFTFTAPDNTRFLIRSHIDVPNNGQRHAEPVEITANGDVSNVKLIITETGGSCAKCREWKRNKN